MRAEIIGAVGALALVSITACAPSVETKVGRPLCVSSVIIVGEFTEVPCDVVPPQRLDLEMSRQETSDGTPTQRCLNYGGRFLPAQSEGSEDICWGVDY